MFHVFLIKNINFYYIIFRFFAKRKTPFGVWLKAWNIQTIGCDTCFGGTFKRFRIMLALKLQPVMSSPRSCSMMNFPSFFNKSFWARRNRLCASNLSNTFCNSPSGINFRGKACTYILVAVIRTAFSWCKSATAGFDIFYLVSLILQYQFIDITQIVECSFVVSSFFVKNLTIAFYLLL